MCRCGYSVKSEDVRCTTVTAPVLSRSPPRCERSCSLARLAAVHGLDEQARERAQQRSARRRRHTKWEGQHPLAHIYRGPD